MINQEIRSLFEGYILHVEKLNPILERMSERGLPINLDKLKAFEKEVDKLRSESYEELCNLYPLDLLPPKQAKGLKKDPKEIVEFEHGSGAPLGLKELTQEAYRKFGYLRGEFEDDLPIFDTFEEACSCKKGKDVKAILERREILARDLEQKGEQDKEAWYETSQWLKEIGEAKGGCKKCSKTGLLSKTKITGHQRGFERRWYQPKPFKPSYHQIKAYIEWKGDKLPTRATNKRETRGKEATTTDKTALIQLGRITGDKFYNLVLSYRYFDKMISTYVEGWWPKSDGRVHSTYLFRPASGQLSSTAPNVQNIPSSKTGELSTKFKSCVEARPGHTLIEFDWKSLHAYMLGFLAKDSSYMRLSLLDIHSYLAAQILNQMLRKDGLEKTIENYARMVDSHNPQPNPMLIGETAERLENIHQWLSMKDKDLAEELKWMNKNHKIYRNKIKPCIAEGELVLTNRGLIPIEKIKLKHKLWDGIEWVKHEGVICKGEKEVIEYQGLRATKDHEVYTRSGWKVPLWFAQRERLELETTGASGQAIRTGHSHFREFDPKWKALESSSALFGLLSGNHLRSPQFTWRQDKRLRSLRKKGIESFKKFQGSRRPIRQNLCGLQSQLAQGLQKLWGPGNSMQFCFSTGIYPLDGGKSPARGLQRSRDRQDQQRWSLRAGEFEIGESKGTMQQYSRQFKTFLEGRADSLEKFPKSLFTATNSLFSPSRLNRGGNIRKGPSKQEQGGEEQGNRVRVFDIVNAGPRQRYTCASRLVSNCAHGFGFGLGAFKLMKGYPDSFASVKEAQVPLDMLNKAFPLVAKFREEIKEIADQQGFLISPYGYIRYFHEVFKKQPISDSYEPKWGDKLVLDQQGRRWKISGGQDAEKAIAFLPANCSFGVVKDKMLEVVSRELDEKFYLINQVHDSLLFEPLEKDVDSCIGEVLEILESPNHCLVSEMAPEGLRCYAAASVGNGWGGMKEVK